MRKREREQRETKKERENIESRASREREREKREGERLANDTMRVLFRWYIPGTQMQQLNYLFFWGG